MHSGPPAFGGDGGFGFCSTRSRSVRIPLGRNCVTGRAETIPRVTRVTRIQKILEANYVPRGIVLSIY